MNARPAALGRDRFCHLARGEGRCYPRGGPGSSVLISFRNHVSVQSERPGQAHEPGLSFVCGFAGILGVMNQALDTVARVCVVIILVWLVLKLTGWP